MKLYDYYEDVGKLGMNMFIALSVMFIIITVLQVIRVIKLRLNFNKVHNKFEISVLVVGLLITIVLSLFFSIYAIKLGKSYYIYNTQEYKIVTGCLQQVHALRDDYRDEELYKVSFNVDNVKFENTNISCDKELLDKLVNSSGKEVLVGYSLTSEGQFVYIIEVHG